MEDIKLIIAKNITDLRKANGYTQISLGEKLNYSDKAVSKWERGESVPEIGVLKEIADLFGVTLDYLVQKDHSSAPKTNGKVKKQNQTFITLMSVILVWLIATVAFVIIDYSTDTNGHWLAFVWAVPISLVVWLVLNSVWFNRRLNFVIVSLLMWTAISTLYLTFLPFGFNIWLVFVVGIPGQIIILLWSRLRYKHKNAPIDK